MWPTLVITAKTALMKEEDVGVLAVVTITGHGLSKLHFELPFC